MGEVIEAANPMDCEDVPLCPEGCMVNAVEPETTVEPLDIHPNPAQDWVRVTLGQNQAERGELILTNTQGQVVMTRTISGPAVELETGHLPAGWYLVQVRHADNLAKGKLVVGRR